MNNVLFRYHSWMAIIATFPLIIICLTGSILVFKAEIDHWLMPEKVSLHNKNPNAERHSLDTLATTVMHKHPDYWLGSWEFFDNKKTADRVYLIEPDTQHWHVTHLDPYSNKLLSDPVPVNHYLTDWLLELHYTLLLHDAGTIFILIIAILFTLLGLTGVILYRHFWKAFFTLRYKARRIIFFSDFHKMFGFISSPVIMILGITGVYFNAVELYYDLVLGHHEKPDVIITQESPFYNQDLSLQQIHDDSLKNIPDFVPTYLLFPYQKDMSFTVYGAVPSKNPFSSDYASTVQYHAFSGTLESILDIRNSNLVDIITDSFRKLHFGHFAGLTSKIIWCVLGGMPVFLAFTGLYLWWKRRPQRKRAKQKRLAALMS